MDLSAAVPAAVAGVGTVVGGLIGSSSQTAATNAATANVAATNAQNQAIAQQNRDFQERMSDTAYQRAVADMRKAGLNPAVMLQGAGSSASTPSGTALPVQSAADSIMAGAREKSRIYAGMAGDSVRSVGDALNALMVPTQKKLVEAQVTNALKQSRILDNQGDLVQRQVLGKEIENQSDALDLQIKGAANSVYLKHPWTYPVREALKDVAGIAGGGFGSAVGGAVGAALGSGRRSPVGGRPVRNPSSVNYTEDQ